MTKQMKTKCEREIRKAIRGIDRDLRRETSRGEHCRGWLVDDWLRARIEEANKLASR